MKCCRSPCPELLLYVSGMLFVIFGMGAMVVSIDPRPFDTSTWKSFLSVGVCFLIAGAILLVLTATVPALPGIVCCDGKPGHLTHMSVVDLLHDVQSVDCCDSPIVKLREAALGSSEESVRAIQGCMMLQSPLAGSEGILFYKETIV